MSQRKVQDRFMTCHKINLRKLWKDINSNCLLVQKGIPDFHQNEEQAEQHVERVQIFQRGCPEQLFIGTCIQCHSLRAEGTLKLGV